MSVLSKFGRTHWFARTFSYQRLLARSRKKTDADHAGVRTSFIGRLDSANPSLRLAPGYLSSSPLTRHGVVSSRAGPVLLSLDIEIIGRTPVSRTSASGAGSKSNAAWPRAPPP